MQWNRLAMATTTLSTFLLLSGCAISPVAGGIVTATQWSGGVSNPGVESTRTGEACAQSVLGLVAVGDASIHAAKRNGQITNVATVDHKTTNVAYFFGQFCTVVRGE